MKIDDLSGKRFGRLTVVKRGTNKGEQTRWVCKCDCGNTSVVFASALKNGNTKSCGCLHREIFSKLGETHGLSNTRLYEIYHGMKKRCYKKESPTFKNYGGRGIEICEECLGEHGFENFYNWAMSNGYDNKLSIDRSDNNGNYCPENCRWSTKGEQANNRRTNHMIEFNRESHNAKEWSKIVGIPYQAILARLNKCEWSIEKTLTTPLNTKRISPRKVSEEQREAAGERFRKMWEEKKGVNYDE